MEDRGLTKVSGASRSESGNVVQQDEMIHNSTDVMFSKEEMITRIRTDLECWRLEMMERIDEDESFHWGELPNRGHGGLLGPGDVGGCPAQQLASP